MLLGLGTARDQWREAGIELHLGRLSAQELHELGERLLSVSRDEREERREHVRRLQRRLEDVEGQRSDAEDAALEADHKAAKLTLENTELRKRIEELERTIRGLQQGGS